MKKVLFLFISLFFISHFLSAQRQMEKLGRGVVAVRTGTNSAFVSWRLLGTEDQHIGFNLYKSVGGASAIKLNSDVLLQGTNYTDNSLNAGSNASYFVKTVSNGVEQSTPSDTFTLVANHPVEPCVVVPLKAGSRIHLVSVGDLDGDGEYDFVIDRIDDTNSSEKVEAYKQDGTCLWTIDLGTGLNLDRYEPGPTVIDVGMWDGITVYDMDGDNKAEVLLKTADGVVFGDGTRLTYSNPNTVFFSVIDGMTGAEKTRTEIPNPYASKGSLGCSLGIGYLNGKTPSLVSFLKNRNDDGSFNRLMYAWSYDGTSLKMEWQTTMPFGTSYGNGSDGHNMRIVDIDGDGKDEVLQIGFALRGEDGSLMYNMGDHGIEHGDRWFIGKLDPYRPGLQGYGSQQYNSILDYYYDAATGKPFWIHYTSDGSVGDVGRASLGDVDPTQEGYETWEFHGLYNAPANKKLAASTPYPNFRLWWDGDLLSENYNDGKFEKWNYASSTVSRLLTAWNYESATGSDRAAPLFYGDIMGDWREEVVMSSSDFSKLVIFTTPDPTDKRLYTLAQNPAYRNCMTIKGYLQSHMPDYYLGSDMVAPPTPPIQTAKCTWKGNASNNVWDESSSNWTVNGATGTYTSGDDVMFDISGDPNTAVVINGDVMPSLIKAITPLDYSFNGTGSITGTAGLLKAGNGALSLNCYADYTDTTRVEEGFLFVNDTLAASSIIVSRGAGIGGNGVVSKPIILSKGSFVEPGAKNETGSLLFKNDLSVPARTTLSFDITDDSTNLVKPSDRIKVEGDLTMADALTFTFNQVDGIVKPGEYPLMIYSGALTGDLTQVKITGLFGLKKSLINRNDTVFLWIEGSRSSENIVWNGASDTWDLQTTSAWNLDDESVTFVANDTVTFDAHGNANPNVKVVGSLPIGNLFVNTGNGDYSFSGTGNIGGTGALVKNGAGTLSLLTTNSFTGTTTVNSGTLEVSSLAAAGKNSSIGANADVSSAAFMLTNATLKYSGSNLSLTDKGMTLGGANDTIDIKNSDGTLIVEGIIAGTGNLIKTGKGVLNLRKSANTFAGNTYVYDGTLLFGDETANLNGVNRGTITLDGGTLTMFNDRSTYTNFTTDIVVPTGATGTLNTDIRCYYRDKLTGGGTLNVYLVGDIDRTIFFGDWSGFTGTMNIDGVSGSTFRIANSYGYANVNIHLGNNVEMYHGGSGTSTGDKVATAVSVGALSGNASSILSGENWTIGNKNLDTKFDGLITGNSISKVGTGTLTLTGSNTYTGGTRVNGGRLLLANTAGDCAVGTGAVSVIGGTLAGSGIITGAVTVYSGGVLEPGNHTLTSWTSKIGTLTFERGLNLATGSTLNVSARNYGTNPSDLLVVKGALSVAGSLTLEIVSGDAVFPLGAKVKIFDLSGATTISGAFTSYNLPPTAENTSWDTSKLLTEGTIEVVTGSGILSSSYGSFSISPNPAQDYVIVPAGLLNESFTISFTKMNGGVALSTEGICGEKINVSGLNSGTYLVKVVSDGKIYVAKLLKK